MWIIKLIVILICVCGIWSAIHPLAGLLLAVVLGAWMFGK